MHSTSISSLPSRSALALALLCAGAVDSAAAQWPCYRGPDGTGVAKGATPPLEWDDEKNLAWKLALPGPGSSSPMIHGKHLVVLCYSGYGDHLDDGGAPEKLVRHVVCVDRESGKLLWDTPIPDPLASDARQVQIKEHGFATPTPTTDGEWIYAYVGHAGLVALDFEGKVQWRSELGSFDKSLPAATNSVERGGKTLSLRWGSAASPLLFEKLVIVNASEQSDSIRAYDKKSGELVWKYASRNLEGCASSPTIAGEGDDAVLVMMLGGEVWGLDPRTGARLWSVETGTRGGISPTPVCDGKIAYTFGGSGESCAIRFARELEGGAADASAGEQDAADPRVAWRSKNLGIPSPVLYKDKLLMVSVRGHASCVSKKDGEVTHDARLAGKTSQVYASPIVAADRLYVVSRKRGCFVYSADGKFELLAHNKFADKSQFNASPVAVGKDLFLRSDTHLYCVRAQG